MFHEIISCENLFCAWSEIDDPKPRLISKASVRDRVVHRAIYRALCHIIDPSFIYASYASRIGKGTHHAFWRVRNLLRAMSKNHTRTCFVLQCDIRKFFDTVDQATLFDLVRNIVTNPQAVELLRGIIGSFHTLPGKGMPLGNLTSQLFANMYMDPFDKFVAHGLGIASYVRYADDFLVVTDDERKAWNVARRMTLFLKEKLSLDLHPRKVTVRKTAWGIDFVGYVALSRYAVPRRKTARRILRKAEFLSVHDPERLEETVPSYLGYFSHVEAYGISQKIRSFIC